MSDSLKQVGLSAVQCKFVLVVNGADAELLSNVTVEMQINADGVRTEALRMTNISAVI